MTHREARTLLALGMFDSSSGLSGRIEALLRRQRSFVPRVSPRVSGARVAAGIAALLALTVVASLSPRWIAFAQQDSSPTFDVASIRPSDDKSPAQGRIRYNPLGVDMMHVPPSWVIGEAYQIPYNRISSSDPRLRDSYFPPEKVAYLYDISARTDQAASRDRIRLMLQTLLADRFKLKVHKESKIEPVYRLTVGKNGVKLQEAAAGGEPSVTPGLDAFVFRAMDMARFSGIMSTLLGRPVVDQTGLTKDYDFTIKPSIPPGGGAIDAQSKATLLDWLTGGFSSDLEKQTGLKMESGRGAVDYLFVDRLEKPSEN
ncbi:MAG TPA: TIGR03435 family protein [Bryobacteraceae bacterium]